jgi:hypothetical protein
MNGHWDVTETKEFLGAFVRARKRCLKRLFSIPSNTLTILALRDKPDVHPESYEMQLYYKSS